MPLASAWAGPALPFQDLLFGGGLAAVYGLLVIAAFLKYTAPFLPGDAALLGGFFWIGVRDGSWGIAILCVVVGGTTGAMAAFAWGRRFGGFLSSRPGRLGAVVTTVRRLLGRWGIWAVAANRFIPGARAFFLPVAGVLHMPAGPVCAAAALSNTLFACLLVAIAYTAGHEYGHFAALVRVYQSWALMAIGVLAAAALVFTATTRALDARRIRLAEAEAEVEP